MRDREEKGKNNNRWKNTYQYYVLYHKNNRFPFHLCSFNFHIFSSLHFEIFNFNNMLNITENYKLNFDAHKNQMTKEKKTKTNQIRISVLPMIFFGGEKKTNCPIKYEKGTSLLETE